MDYREKKTAILPLIISGDCVERVADICFLGVYIGEGLTWCMKSSELLEKAQQRLYFLRVLRRNIITRNCWVFQREHTDLLYMYVVQQRHSGSEEGAPEGH